MSDIYIDVTDECSFTPSHGTELYDNTLLKVLYTDPETSKNYTISKNINVYPREEFNKPYKISHLINDCSDMFNGCTNFDQPITIGSNVDSCNSMFLYCTSLNSDIKIGKNACDLSYMFYRCNNFDANVTIGTDRTDYHTYTTNMFAYCSNFNKSVNFSNNALYIHDNTFAFCNNLDKPIHLGDNVTSLSRVFYHCENFNSPISFSWAEDSGLKSFDAIFDYCNNYSQSLYLPPRLRYSDRTLAHCINFNNYVYFDTSRTTLESLVDFFNGCKNYNYSDISLYSFSALKNLSGFLQYCDNFNKNVYLNWSVVENISHILHNAKLFDCFDSMRSGIETSTTLKNCSWAFAYCPMHFDGISNIVISDSVECCSGMFHSCTNIYSSGSFVFGNNVNNLCATFQNCRMIGDIYIYQNESCNVYAMLFNCPNQYIVNIHCHNLAIINKTSASESVTGYPMTWVYESEGTYYNSAYGIRITNQF